MNKVFAAYRVETFRHTRNEIEPPPEPTLRYFQMLAEQFTNSVPALK